MGVYAGVVLAHESSNKADSETPTTLYSSPAIDTGHTLFGGRLFQPSSCLIDRKPTEPDGSRRKENGQVQCDSLIAPINAEGFCDPMTTDFPFSRSILIPLPRVVM